MSKFSSLTFKGLIYKDLTTYIMAVRREYTIPGDDQPRMTLNQFASLCRVCADTFYHDPLTGEPKFMNPGERFMLQVSELAEAFEAMRKDTMDDHLPERRGAEVEMTDALIRELDWSAECNFDLDGSFWEKNLYNARREDHKPENRIKPGGKKW